MANLARELRRTAEGVTVTYEDDKASWWPADRDILPFWSAIVKKVLLIQSSSATAERVFNPISSNFNAQQESALQDHIEPSVTPRYNRSKRD